MRVIWWMVWRISAAAQTKLVGSCLQPHVEHQRAAVAIAQQAGFAQGLDEVAENRLIEEFRRRKFMQQRQPLCEQRTQLFQLILRDLARALPSAVQW